MPCDCPPAAAEREHGPGHLVVHCQAPGCRSAWYRPGASGGGSGLGYRDQVVARYGTRLSCRKAAMLSQYSWCTAAFPSRNSASSMPLSSSRLPVGGTSVPSGRTSGPSTELRVGASYDYTHGGAQAGCAQLALLRVG